MPVTIKGIFENGQVKLVEPAPTKEKVPVMKILIDTHVLIWVLENNKALFSHHKSILADTNNEKIVSQISFMEIAIKINIGKLPDFKIPLNDFIQQVEKDGFKILLVNNSHITAYTYHLFRITKILSTDFLL